MFSSAVTLNHFIQPIPVCEPTIDLKTFLTLFESKANESVAMVNERGFLMGIVNSSHLLRYLPQLLEFQESANKLQLKECLSEYQDLLSSLATLPAQMSIEQLQLFCTEVATSAQTLQSYGLVDEQGKFLGLLNSWKLLKFFLANASNELTQPRRSHSSKLEQILGEFLEQLPLPILLSSQKGQVLYQNSSWGQKLGDYLPFNPTNPSFCPSSSLSAVHLNQSVYQSNFSTQLQETIEREGLQSNTFLAVQLLSRQAHHNTLGTEFEPLELSPWQLSQALTPSPKPPSSDTTSSSDRSWQFIKLPLSWPSVNFFVEQTWLIMAVDVTEQEQFCQELALKNADLIQLNRLKDEFFTCISHELKSPLTSVIGLSSLLKEQKLGSLNERQVHYSELIYHSGRQLMMLVNDLLDLTRLETKQLKLKLLPLDVKTVCQQAYNSLEERYKGKIDFPIPFILEIDPGIEQIVADELRLQQMLLHLLDNAMKLSDSDGEIGLKVNRWENWVAFTVWDTGTGIPEESQTLLFQQWQSQDYGLSKQLEGTGLGLVLTQRLVKAHGGDISFISRKGRGSQFTLLLPMSSPQKTPENPSSLSISQIYPLVLVVESISETIEQMTDLLIRLGYRTIVARTGTEALEKARQLKPETIFINPLLPLLSGWDVLKLLKSDPTTKQIKIIVTSLPCEQTHSEKVGADSFLSLPVEQSKLEKILSHPNPRSFSQPNHLTILRLHPNLEQADWMGSVIDSQFDLCLGKQLSQLNCRLLEADSLEQAEMIASVWDINVVVLDGKSLKDPLNYLLSLSQCETLATLPLVTLDTEITESANKLGSLSVFPCLLPNHENKIEQLLQVIQIAAEARLTFNCES